MKVVYDEVGLPGVTDGWPGTLALYAWGLYGEDTYWKAGSFDRQGGELQWKAIPTPEGRFPRMWPWWTIELTAEAAQEHLRTWARKLGQDPLWGEGTLYVMWHLASSKGPTYDVALFWVPEQEGVEAPNPISPPWATSTPLDCRGS